MIENMGKILLSEEQLQTRIKELAEQLNKEYADKDPICGRFEGRCYVLWGYGKADQCALPDRLYVDLFLFRNKFFRHNDSQAGCFCGYQGAPCGYS